MYYDTIVQDARALRYLADVVGSDRIMMGSDMPFPIGDLAPLKVIQDTPFSESERAAISGGLATKLFSF
jgi:aminocarboxymuconate-semialdehyde decarboxylase